MIKWEHKVIYAQAKGSNPVKKRFYYKGNELKIDDMEELLNWYGSIGYELVNTVVASFINTPLAPSGASSLLLFFKRPMQE